MYHYLVDDADKPLSEGFWKPSITAVHKTHLKWNIDHGHPTIHSRIVGSIFEKSNCGEHLYFLKSSGGNDRLKSAFTQIVENLKPELFEIVAPILSRRLTEGIDFLCGIPRALASDTKTET